MGRKTAGQRGGTSRSLSVLLHACFSNSVYRISLNMSASIKASCAERSTCREVLSSTHDTCHAAAADPPRSAVLTPAAQPPRLQADQAKASARRALSRSCTRHETCSITAYSMGVSGLPVRKTGMSACSREIPLTSDTSRQTLNAPSIAMLLRSSGPFRLAAR